VYAVKRIYDSTETSVFIDANTAIPLDNTDITDYIALLSNLS